MVFPRQGRRMVIITKTKVTVDEAAEQLGIKPKTIHVWLERGHIHRVDTSPQRMGRPKVVIDIEELRRFLATRQK